MFFVARKGNEDACSVRCQKATSKTVLTKKVSKRSVWPCFSAFLLVARKRQTPFPVEVNLAQTEFGQNNNLRVFSLNCTSIVLERKTGGFVLLLRDRPS